VEGGDVVVETDKIEILRVKKEHRMTRREKASQKVCPFPNPKRQYLNLRPRKCCGFGFRAESCGLVVKGLRVGFD